MRSSRNLLKEVFISSIAQVANGRMEMMRKGFHYTQGKVAISYIFKKKSDLLLDVRMILSWGSIQTEKKALSLTL